MRQPLWFNSKGFVLGPGVGDMMTKLLAPGATITPMEPFSIACLSKITEA